jgi:hypothetical protein
MQTVTSLLPGAAADNTLPSPIQNNVSGLDRPFQEWDMTDVFRAAARALAGEDSFQGQDRHRLFSPTNPGGPPEFGRETSQAGHCVNKIHGQFVAEGHHGIGDDLALQLAGEIEHSDILTRRKINPEIHIEGDGGNTLQHRTHHSDDNKPNLFCSERFDK